MTSLTERRKAILMLVITALLWSTSGVLVKALSGNPSPSWLVPLGVRLDFTNSINLCAHTKSEKNNAQKLENRHKTSIDSVFHSC
jgi:hypothetical protein